MSKLVDELWIDRGSAFNNCDSSLHTGAMISIHPNSFPHNNVIFVQLRTRHQNRELEYDYLVKMLN